MRRTSWTAAVAGAAIALAVPAAAGAKTVTVDAGAGSGGCSGAAPTCASLSDASGVASSGDTIDVKPGAYVESPSFGQGDLTIEGVGTGLAYVQGEIKVTNPGNFKVSRLVGVSASGTPLSFTGTPPGLPGTRTITVEGSTFLTAQSAPAISTDISTPLLGQHVDAVVRHVTAFGSPAVVLNGGGALGVFTGTVKNSIALGGIQPAGVTSTNNDTSSSPVDLFCDSVLHLKKGAPAIGAGGSLDSGEATSDIDGDARGSAPDRGGDQYTSRCDPTPVTIPQSVISNTPPSSSALPPTIAVKSPQDGATVKRGIKKHCAHGRRGRRCRAANRKIRPKATVFTGAAADPLGLNSVQLALRKTGGGSTVCQWYDGTKLTKASCGTPPLLKATLKDFTWTYTIPAKVRLPAGSYQLYATAINRAGVAVTSFSAASGNLIGFKVK
jgi:hypothetical protein